MNLQTLQRSFESEVTIATQSFYTWKSINNIASKNDSIYLGINEQAVVWNIALHSMQTTYFIALGRLFDEDPLALSASTYINACIKHIDQFNAEHLKKRKLDSSNLKEPEWLEDYIANIEPPTLQDLRALKKTISGLRSRYIKVYKPIRNKVMAHRELSAIENTESLFKGTKLADLEDIIIQLNQLHNVIWQYLYNGRKTKLSDHSISEESYICGHVEKLLNRLKA